MQALGFVAGLLAVLALVALIKPDTFLPAVVRTRIPDRPFGLPYRAVVRVSCLIVLAVIAAVLHLAGFY